MVAKLPAFCGWTSEAMKGSTLSNLFAQHVNLHAIEGLQTREDNTATFLAHESYVPTLMKAAGRDGLFIKVHASSENKFRTDLYWLPEEL